MTTSNIKENNFETISLTEQLQSKPCEYYSGIVLIALGIILVLGGLTIAGLYISNAFPHFFNTLGPIPLIATPLISGFIIISVGSYLFMRYKEKCVRVASQEFLRQAEDNIRLALTSHSLDPRRFNVLGTPECPMVQTVSLPRYLMRCLFNSRTEASGALRKALDRSVETLNAEDLNHEKHQILAAKYNRFTTTSPLLKTIAKDDEALTLIGNEQREWGHFERTVKENHEDLTQPIYKKGKWYHKEHQANHGLEAMVIFAETQLKRLGRLLSFGTCCKYFSRDETETDIYKHDEPQLHTETPTVQNLGHATLLCQMGKMNVLTDPIFGGLNPVFYPRQTEPGLTADELPPIDVILISHNHRDHCDINSLKQLVPHQPILLVPKGDFNRFRDLGFTNVQEHEWWMTTTISCNGETVDFHSVPARHWSGTGACDVQESLMCSWVFKRRGDEGAVYFRGDTASIPTTTMQEIVQFIQAPIMVNFEPGGPNHRRRWMESTHQSVLDSMVSCFEVNPHPEQCMTYLMHHNVYELGTDRFNEAIIIKDQILIFLNGSLSVDDETFYALPEFVQNELQGGVLERIQEIGVQKFINHINQYFRSPKIGERLELRLNQSNEAII